MQHNISINLQAGFMSRYYVSSPLYILSEIKYSRILFISHQKYMSTKQFIKLLQVVTRMQIFFLNVIYSLLFKHWNVK